ncbi:MAG: glutamine-hydrolyzing carbamoyl-phosphate synthase small subunit [Chthoniobacterales bacterium]|nr:glutamine-hydrolyzing carbamoyl-phosphate synthase small subunit [Chthoniobacterales bacterium]
MPHSLYPPAVLVLEDGSVFSGVSQGAVGTCTGEICFNTSMSGYQEVLTDPSYRGQIVTMTYPQMGNYGITLEDQESSTIHVRGFVVEEISDLASNYRSESRLQEYLQKNNIVAIGNVDTRALTRHLRNVGVMRACITTELNAAEALVLAKSAPFLEEADLVEEVSTKEIYEWDPHRSDRTLGSQLAPDLAQQVKEPLVVTYDFGIKRNILRLLRWHGMRVIVVPSTTSAEEVLGMNPDGLFFSNGPGDPAKLSQIHQTAHFLCDHKPVFGICLGLQILGHAFGAKTFKLKFGHRGANHPVQDLRTGKVLITAQNHGYAVEEKHLPAELKVTHRHLNDQTIAGFCHRSKPVLAVQFHPEASPGPHDSISLFREFLEMMS